MRFDLIEISQVEEIIKSDQLEVDFLLTEILSGKSSNLLFDWRKGLVSSLLYS